MSLNANSLLSSNHEKHNISITTATGEVLSIDIQDLTGALSKEIDMLRQELSTIRSERENELRNNLLTYIQAMPESEMVNLTTDMSQDVLQAIRLFVHTIMNKIGANNVGSEVIVQQGFGQLAHLCMWQMVVGYKLRELEAVDNGVSLE